MTNCSYLKKSTSKNTLNETHPFRLLGLSLGIISLLALSATSVSAQFGDLTDKLKKKTPNLLGGKAPITTSLPDAKWEDASKDGFTPREDTRSLMVLQRTSNGGFVLQPGYYALQMQSYCLKAGTHGPGGGDGYLYAPPKGPAEDAVMTIVRNSVNHPEIQQQDIQSLRGRLLLGLSLRICRTS